jgi:hypothetical protein
LTPNDPAFQPGFEHADTSITAAVCLYGYHDIYYGRDPLARPSSSLLHPAGAAPPFSPSAPQIRTEARGRMTPACPPQRAQPSDCL